MPASLPSLATLGLPQDLLDAVKRVPKNFLDVPTDAPPAPCDGAQTIPHAAGSDTPPLNPAALALALLGWTGSQDSASYGVASCSACFRRLGLWLYVAKPNTPSSSDPTSTATHDGDDDVMKLDIVYNHRDYCPWINATSQSMPGTFTGLAGFEILLRLVRNELPALQKQIERPASSASSAPLPQVDVDDPAAATAVEAGTPPEISPARKHQKQVEKEDKARFARLRELTRSMGLKKIKSKLSSGR